MEFGPRALGARSILGDARSPDDAEDAQPEGQVPRVASARSRRRCCARTSRDWFELDDDSPYMLLVADVVTKRRRAMTRGRAGAVRHRQAQRAALGHPGRDPRRLLGAHPDRAPRDQPALSRAALRVSSERTGCPVLVNTSFNVRGEPIVCTPEDAFRCFMGTEIETPGGRQLPAAQGGPGPARSSATTRTRSSSTDDRFGSSSPGAAAHVNAAPN